MLTADGMLLQDVDAAKRLQVERRMLDLLVHGMRQVLLTSIIIGPALTTWLTLPHIGVARSVTPLVILLGFGAERVFLLRRMARKRALRDDTPRRWASALCWRWVLGSIVVLTWFHFAAMSGNGVLLFEMLALLTILAAGGAALFSSWPPVMWAVVSPLLLGMAVQLVLLGGPSHKVGAVFCTVLWVVLVSANLRAARTLHNETLAHLRNQELLRQLEQKHAEAEAANKAKTRFFAAANHDLRQPLQAMGLYLSTLQLQPDHLEQDQNTLVRMRQCMRTLDQMLETLLNYSRLDAAQLAPNQHSFALQPLFERLASTHAAVAQQRGLTFRVRPTEAWVRSDSVLLERVLSNLLANALRYTSHGGVLLAARQRGRDMRLCVADTGPGIPEAMQDAIYEEFVQLDNPGRDPQQGHGLGLATVRQIAGLLGHTLSLRSRVGRGSIFSLDVQTSGPDLASKPRPPPVLPARLRGRVLVVEDHADARDALVQQLTGWGMKVDAVSDGKAARAALARTAFDAVLSDWRLSGSVDGVTILRDARALQPDLKLALLITGEDARLLRELSPGVPVLRKPLRPLRLRTLLAQHLDAAVHAATPKTAARPPVESARR